MSLSVMVKQRDLSADVPLGLPVIYRVDSYSWRALGGPAEATITVYGQARALYDLVEMLRCPVEICNERGEYVWWGYVSGVDIRVDAVEMGVDLETMANRIQALYHQGAYALATGWSSDADSDAAYGTKELLLSFANIPLTEAQARRDTSLQQMRLPIPTIKMEGHESSFSATLRCRGWWQTLGWRYYANGGAASVDLVTLLDDILLQSGQFLSSRYYDVTGGVATIQTRDGYTQAQAEAEALLLAGTPNSRRMLATVQRDRSVRVYEEAAPGSADYLLRSTGELRTGYDTPVPPEVCPVGVWCRLVDLQLAGPDVSKLANPTLAMIDAASYNALTHTRTLYPRVQVWPWQREGL